LYYSQNVSRLFKSKRMRLVGFVVRMEVIKNAYKILFEKPEGKRPLGRFRYQWEDNIKIHLKKYSVRVWTGFIWPRMESLG